MMIGQTWLWDVLGKIVSIPTNCPKKQIININVQDGNVGYRDMIVRGN